MSGITLKRMSVQPEELKRIKETLSDLKRMVDSQPLSERASKMIHLSIPKILIQRTPKSPTKEDRKVENEHQDTITTGICIQLTPPSPDKRRKLDIDGSMLKPLLSFQRKETNEVKSEKQQETVKKQNEGESKLFGDTPDESVLKSAQDPLDDKGEHTNSLLNLAVSSGILPSNSDCLQQQSVNEIGNSILNTGTVETANQEKEACLVEGNEGRDVEQIVEEKVQMKDTNIADHSCDESSQQSNKETRIDLAAVELRQNQSIETAPQSIETLPHNNETTQICDLNLSKADHILDSSFGDPGNTEIPAENRQIKLNEPGETKTEGEIESAIQLESQLSISVNSSQLIQPTEVQINDEPTSNTELNESESMKMDQVESVTHVNLTNSESEIDYLNRNEPNPNDANYTEDRIPNIQVTDSVCLEIIKVFSQSITEIEETAKPDLENEVASKEPENPFNVNNEKEEMEKDKDESNDLEMEIEENHSEMSLTVSNKMEEENDIETKEIKQRDAIKNGEITIIEKPSDIIPLIDSDNGNSEIRSDFASDSNYNSEQDHINESVMEAEVSVKQEIVGCDKPVSSFPTVDSSANSQSVSKNETSQPEMILNQSNETKRVIDSSIQIDLTNSDSPLSNESDEVNTAIHSSIQADMSDSNSAVITQTDESKQAVELPNQSELSDFNLPISNEPKEISESVDSSNEYGEVKDSDSPTSKERSDSKSMMDQPNNVELKESNFLVSDVSHQTASISSFSPPQQQSMSDDFAIQTAISSSPNQHSITEFFKVTKNSSSSLQNTIKKESISTSPSTTLTSSLEDNHSIPSTNPSNLLSLSSSSSYSIQHSEHLESNTPSIENSKELEPIHLPNEINSIQFPASIHSRPSSVLTAAPFKPPRSLDSSSLNPTQSSRSPLPSISTPPSSLPSRLISVKDLPISLESKMNSILNQLDSQISRCHQPYHPVSCQPTPPPIPPPSLSISHLVFVYISNRGCAVGIESKC